MSGVSPHGWTGTEFGIFTVRGKSTFTCQRARLARYFRCDGQSEQPHSVTGLSRRNVVRSRSLRLTRDLHVELTTAKPSLGNARVAHAAGPEQRVDLVRSQPVASVKLHPQQRSLPCRIAVLRPNKRR
jgi:hypothetical protein